MDQSSVSQAIDPYAPTNGSINPLVNQLIHTPKDGLINLSASQPINQGVLQRSQLTMTGNQDTSSTELPKALNVLCTFCLELLCVSHSLSFD